MSFFFYCEPAVAWPVTESRRSREPPPSAFSGPGCDGWAEEDPGNRASACSSSVPSSVKEGKEKKTHQPGVAFSLACSIIVLVGTSFRETQCSHFVHA